jgi:hypothetical protein
MAASPEAVLKPARQIGGKRFSSGIVDFSAHRRASIRYSLQLFCTTAENLPARF